MDEEIMEIGSDESVNLLNEGIYSQLGKEWYRKTRDETEKIRAILLEHLAVNVPECYSKITSPNLKIIANENECRVRLVHPVEYFLFGEEPSSGFAKLKELNNPPQLCGRVFKVGEPTYSCRYVPCCVMPAQVKTIFISCVHISSRPPCSYVVVVRCIQIFALNLPQGLCTGCHLCLLQRMLSEECPQGSQIQGNVLFSHNSNVNEMFKMTQSRGCRIVWATKSLGISAA